MEVGEQHGSRREAGKDRGHRSSLVHPGSDWSGATVVMDSYRGPWLTAASPACLRGGQVAGGGGWAGSSAVACQWLQRAVVTAGLRSLVAGVLLVRLQQPATVQYGGWVGAHTDPACSLPPHCRLIGPAGATTALRPTANMSKFTGLTCRSSSPLNAGLYAGSILCIMMTPLNPVIKTFSPP